MPSLIYTIDGLMCTDCYIQYMKKLQRQSLSNVFNVRKTKSPSVTNLLIDENEQTIFVTEYTLTVLWKTILTVTKEPHKGIIKLFKIVASWRNTKHYAEYKNKSFKIGTYNFRVTKTNK